MHVVSAMLKATESLREVWAFIANIANIWPSWPALREMVLPRFRLACNRLTAMLESASLVADEGRHAFAAAFTAVGFAFRSTDSVHQCGGSAESHTDPLVAELAQVLVLQPQFLQLLKAGTAWARQHDHMGLTHLYSNSVSSCLDGIIACGMESLHQCLCPSSPLAIDPAAPKLCQAAHDWFAFALEMLKAGGGQGNWAPSAAESLLKHGMGIPLYLMNRRVYQQDGPVQPLPWADRFRYLGCALQAAEWMLSPAGASSCNEEDRFQFVWRNSSNLASVLASGGEVML